tara:strand:+ start:344 stop:757 length:414 start_codon:yes stop_codon:yes gene_type:complete
MSAPPQLSKAALRRRAQRRNKQILAEIKKLQASSARIIPRTSFARIVSEVLEGEGEYHIRSDAITALQVAAEDHVTRVFGEANNIAMYAGRETVSDRDFAFVSPCAPCAVASSFELEDDDADEEDSEHLPSVPDLCE